MGYACPVCGDPQADARHLANHLAFTAMLGREDHEAWLDEHAPGWADDGERALADRVEDRAEETDYPQVFEDTTDRRGDDERSGALFDHEGHGRDRGRDPDHPRAGRTDGIPHDRAAVDTPSGEEMEAVMAEARELTREMLEDGDDDDVDGDDAAESGDETADER